MNRLDAARVLEVAPAAGPADIEAAFRRLAQRTHPDAGGDRIAFERAVRARRTLLATSAPPDATWAITSAQLRRKHRDQMRRRWRIRLGLNTTHSN